MGDMTVIYLPKACIGSSSRSISWPWGGWKRVNDVNIHSMTPVKHLKTEAVLRKLIDWQKKQQGGLSSVLIFTKTIPTKNSNLFFLRDAWSSAKMLHQICCMIPFLVLFQGLFRTSLANGHNRLLAAMAQETFQNQMFSKLPLTLSTSRHRRDHFCWYI